VYNNSLVLAALVDGIPPNRVPGPPKNELPSPSPVVVVVAVSDNGVEGPLHHVAAATSIVDMPHPVESS
jgi:hypothetical protein